MFPLRDDRPTYTPPVVTTLLIVACACVFLHELTLDDFSRNYFLERYAVVPARLNPITLVTSLFVHAGWMHIIGNMLFLWAFGKSLEDAMGHVKFFSFYMLCGVAAGIVHVFFNYYSRVPTVGASGAIAGVMGAYLIKFPRAWIHTLVFIIVFVTTVDIPAWFFTILLVCHAVVQRFRIHRPDSGFRRWHGLVCSHRRVSDRHAAGHDDGHAQPLCPPSGERVVDVLAIAAHPDDVEQTCGGTLLRMAEAGYSTGIIDLTAGDMGTRGSPEIRVEESEAAARILGVSHRENLHFPDARLENTHGRAHDAGAAHSRTAAAHRDSPVLGRPAIPIITAPRRSAMKPASSPD